MGSYKSILKFAIKFASCLGLVAIGFLTCRQLSDAPNPSSGRMVYGRASVQSGAGVVCIKDVEAICAPLFRGPAPPDGVQVRGWLIPIPYDSDDDLHDVLWAFVTTMGTREAHR